MTDAAKGMTYAGSGVNYGDLDTFKRAAQEAAQRTYGNIARLGLRVVSESCGESAFLIDGSGKMMPFLGHVEEGLGTKNLVADKMQQLTGNCFYRNVAQCTVAMIVNDMATMGILPISLAMHLGVASGDWFNDKARYENLIEGWKHACDLSRCVWGGGETPALKGIIVPGASLLSGSALGCVDAEILKNIRKFRRVLKTDSILPIEASRISEGDAIIIFHSSGIHANGLTLARKIADEKLENGYLTELYDGRTYGESLLDPTHIYVGVMEDILRKGVDVHYALNVTGHGWRKFMRATNPNLAYVIDKLPPQLPIFDFIREKGPVDIREAYGNLNMGAGFAVYVPWKDVAKVLNTVEMGDYGFSATLAGHIEKSPKGKRVVINPVNLEYKGEELGVR